MIKMWVSILVVLNIGYLEGKKITFIGTLATHASKWTCSPLFSQGWIKTGDETYVVVGELTE